MSKVIGQFGYFKIQLLTVDLRLRLQGIITVNHYIKM